MNPSDIATLFLVAIMFLRSCEGRDESSGDIIYIAAAFVFVMFMSLLS